MTLETNLMEEDLFRYDIMKKVQLVFIVMLIVVITSCVKRDYTCTCTHRNGTSIEDYNHVTKKKAEEYCNMKANDLFKLRHPSDTIPINCTLSES